jgi:protein phosphatase 1 regulatory subunit 11
MLFLFTRCSPTQTRKGIAMADSEALQMKKEEAARRTETQHEEQAPRQPVLMMRLRRADDEEARLRRIRWVDGIPENRGQKTSKKCCQFHRKRLFGESSSDDSSDDDFGQPAAAPHHHDHDGPCDHAKPAKKQRPKCSKASCVCGTRFA